MNQSLPKQDIESLSPTSVELANGLRVLVVHLPHAHRQVLHAQLTVGSRFEAPEENGLSHFLEHMMYRGTPRHPSAHALSLAFERQGGTLMASTATDSGDLIIVVPPSNFALVAQQFGEVFTSPLFNGIETERGIVTEEILEGLDDAGTSIDASDLIRATVFADHPLGMPITGSIEHVRGFSEEQLRGHHARYYAGANTVLASAGPLEPEAVKQMLEAQFRGVARGSLPVTSAPAAQTAARFRYVSHRSSQTQLRLAFRAPGMHDADHAATEVLIRLLDDGMSTRLYHRLCDAKGLCYDVAGNYEAYVDSGLLEFSAETGHERASLVLAELLDLLRELRDAGPTDAELEGVKQRFRWQLDLLLDSVTEAAQFFATELQNGTRRSPMQRWHEINAVSREALMTVAQRWLTASNLTLIAVGSLSKAQLKSVERLVASFT